MQASSSQLSAELADRPKMTGWPSEFHGAGTRAVARKVTPLPVFSRAGAAIPLIDSVELSCVVFDVRIHQFLLDNRALLRPCGSRASDRASCVHTGGSRGGSKSRGGSRSGCRRRAVNGPSEFHGAGTGAVASKVTPLPVFSRAGAAVPLIDSVELICVVVVVR